MKVMNSMVAVLVICAVLSGCAGMSDQTRTRTEGTAVGAVIGGLVGLAIGDGEGAAIGALAGAGIGYLAGNEIAKRKKNYASTEKFLDAEIANYSRVQYDSRSLQQENIPRRSPPSKRSPHRCGPSTTRGR